ncbi:MAG: SGNH/GDSL hydrolase family protein [Cytophagaceae bacterium]
MKNKIGGKLSTLLLSILVIGSALLGCKKKKADEVTPTPVDTTMIQVKADNPNIQYMGRIDFSNTLAPAYSFPGVSIKAKFQGPAIDVVIKDNSVGGATTTNYYDILIDDVVTKVLMVNSTDTIYKAARNLTDAEHTIEIFKRTESNVGKSSFKGFLLRTGKALVSLPAQTSRRIEFIGDSFTCGYGDEASIAAPPTGDPNTGFHSINENNYTAWGAVTCRMLNAQYVCTAYSGRGMYRNNTGSTSGTIPNFYNKIHPDLSVPLWNTTNYIPDVAVIHLGTNDLAPEAWSSPSMLDSASFVNAYITFITTLRSNYPSAHFIVTLPNGITDYYPSGAKQLTRMTHYNHAIVDHFVNGGDTRVHYFALTTQNPPYGEDWHPSNATQLSMSNQIVPFIQTIMGW